jgi:hypothetical protein
MIKLIIIFSCITLYSMIYYANFSSQQKQKEKDESYNIRTLQKLLEFYIESNDLSFLGKYQDCKLSVAETNELMSALKTQNLNIDDINYKIADIYIDADNDGSIKVGNEAFPNKIYVVKKK